MSARQRVGAGIGNVWAVVVILVSVLGAIVTLSLADADATNLITFIGAGVTPTLTIILIGGRLETKTDDIRREVNGRFSEALSKIPDPPKSG